MHTYNECMQPAVKELSYETALKNLLALKSFIYHRAKFEAHHDQQVIIAFAESRNLGMRRKTELEVDFFSGRAL